MKTPTRYSSGPSERARGARPPVVMVVDDERLVADTLSLIFQKAGFVVHTAYSATEALRLANEEFPDVLLSDVDMPGRSGVELAMTMLEWRPGCAVILFSGHATISDLSRAQEAGFDFPLMPKPVHPQILLESVSARLGVEIPEELRVLSPGKRPDGALLSA